MVLGLGYKVKNFGFSILKFEVLGMGFVSRSLELLIL